MNYLLITVSVYCLIATIFIDRGVYKDGTALYIKLGNTIITFIILLYLLLVPIYVFRAEFALWNLFFFVFVMINRSVAKNYYKEELLTKNEKYGVFAVAFKTYLFVYLPVFSMYCFRFLEVGTSVFYTVVVFIVLYGFFYIIKRLRLSRYAKIGNMVMPIMFIGVVAVALLLVTGKINVPYFVKYSEENGVVRTRSTFEDFYSTNLAMIDDSTRGGRVVAFTMDETYLYYVVETVDENKPYPQMFHVYDIANEEEIYQYELDQEMFVEDGFISSEVGKNIMIINDEIYCFLEEGIYIYNNQTFEKISDLHREDIEVFMLDNEVHIFTEDNKLIHQVLKVSRDLEVIDEIPRQDSVYYNVYSDMLIREKDDKYTIYASNPEVSFYNPSGYVRFISDTHLISLKDYSFTFGDVYNVVDSEGYSTTRRSQLDLHTYSPINRYSDMYYVTDKFTFDMNYKSWFIDDEGNKVFSYNFAFLNPEYANYTDSDSVIAKTFDDQVVYMHSTYEYGESNELYFEINQLQRQEETNLDFLNQYLVSLNIYFFVIMGFMTGSNVRIKNVKKENEVEKT